VVHLVEVDGAPSGDDPSLEHFALRGENLEAFLALLDDAGIGYRIGVVPGHGTRQVNIHDPDGNHLHVDFAPSGEPS
jgi:catechol 2,3-dioxygenase-like lactoylglutathione lyase family enzyme